MILGKEDRVIFNELLEGYVEKVKDEKYFNTSVQYFIPVIKRAFRKKRTF